MTNITQFPIPSIQTNQLPPIATALLTDLIIADQSGTGIYNWSTILALLMPNITQLGTITGNIVTLGNVKITALGKGLSVQEGANAKQGIATLVSGSIAVPNTSVTASSRIFVSNNGASGTVGALSVAITASVGFTVTSTSGTDNSVIAWEIFE